MKLILFSHHKVDELTIDRFNTVKKLNPSWDVIPIGFEAVSYTHLRAHET